jgi:hypothetical protein
MGHDRFLAGAVLPIGHVASLLAVECDRPDPAAVAAGSGDPSRTVDDGRCLQTASSALPSKHSAALAIR